MKLNIDQIGKNLFLLGHILEREGSDPIHLVVCGGASLIITGMVQRTTKDVDVVAIISDHEKKRLQYADPLPASLLKAAKQVADDFGLDGNWLNNDPKDLLKFGLPEGFIDRLHTKIFGSRLTVSFIGRFDQIHFKVYAAVDGGPGRHVDDLLALNPDRAEIEQAAFWAMGQDSSKEFKNTLKEMLEVLHFENVAKKL